MANQHGINISFELGQNINKALFKGDTDQLFSLLASYIKENDLNVPKSAAVSPVEKMSYEDDMIFDGALLR